MRNTVAKPRLTLATSIVLLALLPAAAAADESRSTPVLDEPAATATTAQARVSVVEVSGALVWMWRVVAQDRQVAEPLPLSRFAPEEGSEQAPLERAPLFAFGEEPSADRGRLHHGGNLLRIDF